ncbi:Chloroperoxidase, partial [Infundibulicybe gibba]
HNFIRADPMDSRAPCPALNALANQGYISRNGKNIAFTDLVYALRVVYNLSFPLAFFLTTAGFLTCAHLRLVFPNKQDTHKYLYPHLSWTLDLADLAARGPTKITHDASLVHLDSKPSTSPDPKLLTALLQYAASPSAQGLALKDLAHIHSMREASLGYRLCALHEQVAEGECGLMWGIMRCKLADGRENERRIPRERLEQWLGEERLPDGWWNGVRPDKEVGLVQARMWVKEVGRDI